MRRRPDLITALVATAVVLAATSCGGDDGDVGDSTGEVVAVTGANNDEGTDAERTAAPGVGAEDNAGDGSGGAGSARASVVIGDSSYEFSLDADITTQCIVFPGSAIIGNGFALDANGEVLRIEDSGLEKNAQIVDFEITPTDYASLGGDPPWITVEDELNGRTWIADPRSQYQFAPGTSQVDSWTFEGRMASGTATFSDPTGERPPTSGTFELSCE